MLSPKVSSSPTNSVSPSSLQLLTKFLTDRSHGVYVPSLYNRDHRANGCHAGGTDRTRYTGKISYVYVFRVEPLLVKTTIVIHAFSPITTTSPANAFWGIDQSVHYGTEEILATTAGIVDTGKWKLSYNILADGSKVIYHSRNHSHPYCHGWIQQIPVRYRGCSRQCDWTASHYRRPILGSEASALQSW